MFQLELCIDQGRYKHQQAISGDGQHIPEVSVQNYLFDTTQECIHDYRVRPKHEVVCVYMVGGGGGGGLGRKEKCLIRLQKSQIT